MKRRFRNERGGFLSRFILLILLAYGGWWLYKNWWPSNNPQVFSGRLESAINQELSRAGVRDRDVLSQVRKEHHRWKIVWVESQRSIQMTNTQTLHELASRLTQVAHRFGCAMDRSTEDSRTVFQISKFSFLLQKLTFVATAKPTEKPHPVAHARAAIVIDDVAYETASMDRFASLGIPLTFAILPRERHSAELSRKAIAMHFAVMLHLPMEPLDVVHNDPGPSALLLKMSDAELKHQFDRDVASVPNIVGINNHMGSAFTENEERMKLVLGWVKKRNVYFLDSRTSTHSMGCKAAAEVGVPCLANQTFLDNSDDVKSIEAQLDQVMALALKKGQTIAIGHYRRKYLVQALMAKIPEFQSRGVQIVSLPTYYAQ